MNCIDFTSKGSKMFELRRKTFKTMQNYESDQIIMNCINLTSKRSKTFELGRSNYKSNQITMNYIDLTSNQSKMLRNVAKHSKQRITTKVIILQ